MKTWLAVFCLFLMLGATSPAISQTTEEAPEPECKLPEVATDLAKRVERDQKARLAMIESMKKPAADDKDAPSTAELNKIVRDIDQENTAWLGKQVEQHGWLGKTLVGEKGAHNAWLLVQHADANLEFQKKCLAMMEKMPEGEVSKVEIAYLTDRVLAAQGLPQRYGTQCSMNNGKATVNTVEDPENLNQRRAEVGLDTIEEYLKTVEKMYGNNKSSS